ncbi:MAG: VTT domain-containing protein [Candidatus Babeliales bacterium]
MKRKIKKAFLIGLVLLITIILFYYFDINDYLTLENLKNHKNYLKEIVKNNYLFSIICYLGTFVNVIIFCIPVTPPLSIISGFLFGFLPGLLYALIGATIGAAISFLLMRYVFKNLITIYLHQQIEKFNRQISVYGMAYDLLILQFATIPFFIINALAALGKVSIWVFIWTTFVGSLPSFFIYALAGKQISKIESIYDVFSFTVIVVFVLLIGVMLFPLFFRKFR